MARLSDIEVWAISRCPDIDEAATGQRPAGVEVRIFADQSQRRSYPTRDSTDARTALAEKFLGPDSPDIVHVEGHYLAHLLPEEIVRRAVVVEHNVESHLLVQRAASIGLTPKLAADIEKLLRTEEQVWRNAGRVVTLSTEDRARVLRRAPGASVTVSTDGADHIPARQVREIRDTRKPTFGFLANYAYSPNEDALNWLLEEILLALHDRLPESQLILAGSNLDKAVGGRALPSGVEACGWVDDLNSFWGAIDILLCPLRIGGGVKVKMIEALRSGVPAVSTSVGLEGLSTAAREAISRADGAQNFAHAAARLVTNPSLWREQRDCISRAQRTLPTWEAVAERLHCLWFNVAQPTIGGIAHGK